VQRMFWVALGLGAGATVAVMASRWARQQREAYSPVAIGRQAARVAKDTGSLFGAAFDEFRRGMAEREAEIRSSLPS